jgi:hypothetical protein
VEDRSPIADDGAMTGHVLEIACDESGSDGENLIGGNTDVFAHASVRLDIGSAAEHVQEVRNRIRSPAEEYKANHLLRTKHRPVLVWLLGPAGPIHGSAHVHLTDKALFAVGKVVDLLGGDQPMAVTLYREGPRTLGPQQWQAFLSAANNLMRTRNRWDVTTPVESFFRLLDVLRPVAPQLMDPLRQGRPRAEAFRTRILDTPDLIPALDPFIPAVARTIAYWSENGNPVSIVHDRQNSLTDERIAWLKEGRLADLRLVESFSDPRIQLADFLAGVARKIASDQLNDRADPELGALLRPYVDPSSIWLG